MNPLAQSLNDVLNSVNPHVYNSLSELGKNLYFPKGIISQTAEAKEKAHHINATIGIATSKNKPMFLPSIGKHIKDLDPSEVYSYAPTSGRPLVRKLWKEKIIRENQPLNDADISLPVVTSAITHGLSIVGDLFLDPNDLLLLPDKYWGNYNLTFGILRKVMVKTYQFFNEKGALNNDSLKEAIEENAKTRNKIVLILNFPNNPTGYYPSDKEYDDMTNILLSAADKTNIIVIADDAYYGLFFTDHCAKRSIFSRLANKHERLLAVKLDAATKEVFFWGLRTGFITFSMKNNSKSLFEALEKKTMGAIRGNISNSPNISQSLLERLLQSTTFEKERQEAYDAIKERALLCMSLMESGAYKDTFDYYPFNSGYFFCLKLPQDINAEELRLHLLDKHGVGTISIGNTDLRLAFSSIEKEQIKDLLDIVKLGVQEMRKK